MGKKLNVADSSICLKIFENLHNQSQSLTLRLVSPSRLAVVMRQVPSGSSDDNMTISHGMPSFTPTRTISPTFGEQTKKAFKKRNWNVKHLRHFSPPKPLKCSNRPGFCLLQNAKTNTKWRPTLISMDIASNISPSRTILVGRWLTSLSALCLSQSS